MAGKRFDWADQMYSVIAQHESESFAWGANDCCLFVARVLDAMTDSSHAALLAEKYSDEQSAIAFIREHGSLAAAVSEFLGAPVEKRAVRGDVVLFEGGQGDAVGICLGSKIVGMGQAGIQSLGREAIKTVWGIE